MNEVRYKCYYQGCKNDYQCRAGLVRHINSTHLDCQVISCNSCSLYTAIPEASIVHQLYHNPLPSPISRSSKFLLSQHYFDPKVIIPESNILKYPVLPPIEESRKENCFKYKLPITPEILSALLPNHGN